MDKPTPSRIEPQPEKPTLIQTALRIVLGISLLQTGVGHLTWARTEFLAQVPTWLPVDGDFVVVVSGIVELLLGVALVALPFVLPRSRVWLGVAAAVFFVLIFPGNISQYVNQIDALGMNSDEARLIRLFFQPVLVIWALWSTGAWQAWRAWRNTE